MIQVKDRKKIGNLIRILMDWDKQKMAKELDISYNSLVTYESGRYNSQRIDKFYQFYYKELNIEKILVTVGCFRTFNKLNESVGGK